MRVLMLGWEFPPHISGGLGTACAGLTRALSEQGVEITFILPRPMGSSAGPAAASSPRQEAEAVRLLTPTPLTRPATAPAATTSIPPIRAEEGQEEVPDEPGTRRPITFRIAPSRITSPYPGMTGGTEGDGASGSAAVMATSPPPRPEEAGSSGAREPAGQASRYAGDLIAEAHRYVRKCLDLAEHERFDLVHAHDWLTFPAGAALADRARVPLLVHVHSTEYDRSGEQGQPRIREIERAGLEAADRVIAVSHLTRSVLQNRYEADPSRIRVVYNGIDSPPSRAAREKTASTANPTPEARAKTASEREGGDEHQGQTAPETGHGDPIRAFESTDTTIRPTDRIVLYLGRITRQKGPEYFLEAAKKVLQHYEKVKFVMAGGGDQADQVIEQVTREGLASKVLFTGFLDSEDVDRVFNMADVYVMPSVSEPFGLAALEAIRHDVPTIISRTSGVSEVLRHVLKVDFWDTDDIADKILAVLHHPSLATTLRYWADIETRHMTWSDAAAKIRAVYAEVTHPVRLPEMEHP